VSFELYLAEHERQCVMINMKELQLLFLDEQEKSINKFVIFQEIIHVTCKGHSFIVDNGAISDHKKQTIHKLRDDQFKEEQK